MFHRQQQNKNLEQYAHHFELSNDYPFRVLNEHIGLLSMFIESITSARRERSFI